MIRSHALDDVKASKAKLKRNRDAWKKKAIITQKWAARWKAAAKRLRKRQADNQAFDDVCATEEYLFEDPT